MTLEISAQVEQEALTVARWTLEQQLRGNHTPRPELTDPLFDQKRGAFVTLRRHDELRGCVGRVEPLMALGEEIQDLAIGAATRDPRFPPVTRDEVDELTIEISILTPPEVVEDVSEIQTGKHGLIVERGPFRGLLLPQVATEEGWDVKTFLEHACLKAGQPTDVWRKKDTVIYRFLANVFSE